MARRTLCETPNTLVLIIQDFMCRCSTKDRVQGQNPRLSFRQKALILPIIHYTIRLQGQICIQAASHLFRQNTKFQEKASGFPTAESEALS